MNRLPSVKFKTYDMSEVKFYLENRKDKETGKLTEVNVPVSLFYSFNGMRLQYYTGIRIDRVKWDAVLMKVKKNHEAAAETNKALRALATKIDEIHTRANALGEKVTPEYFRDHLNGKKRDAKVGQPIWEYYNEYLKGLNITHVTNTINVAKTTRNTLLKFSKETRTPLTFDKIDAEFWENFLDWCFNTKKWYNNYTGTLIRKFVAFLNWAVKKGYTKNIKFRDVQKLSENTEIIYLTFSELHHFLNFSFEINEHKIIRDVYCLGCYTGMRQQDIKKLLPENIQGDNIVFRVGKTKNPNIVPLNQYSRLLLEKNAGLHPVNCMPKVGNYSKMLKNAMKTAGLDRKVQIVHYRGAERFETIKPLWDAATPHTSKKTFVTGFLEGGGNLTTAMGITGNTSTYIMRRYYKIADQFKTTEMHRIFGK